MNESLGAGSLAFNDETGVSWVVRELFLDELPAALVVFSRPGECRFAWGTPINWRDPSNLPTVFALSRSIPPTLG